MLPECQDCGACCFKRFPEHVLLYPRDLERLTPEERARLVETRLGRFMRMEERLAPGTGLLNCAALEVRDGRYSCSIYERRPDACRSFERGRSGCREVFEEQGAIAIEKLTADHDHEGAEDV